MSLSPDQGARRLSPATEVAGKISFPQPDISASSEDPYFNSIPVCLAARGRALELDPKHVSDMLHFIRTDTGFPPTREAFERMVITHSSGNLGVMRCGDEIHFNLEDESLAPILSARGKAILDYSYGTGIGVWYPALSAAFRHFYDSLAVGAKRNIPSDLRDVEYRCVHLGELIVMSDRAKGPSLDFYVNEGRNFTPQVIDGFVEFLQGYHAQVTQRICTLQDVLLSEVARQGLLPRAMFEAVIRQVAGVEESEYLLRYVALRQERAVNALISNGLGALFSFGEDDAVLGGYQLTQKEPGWKVCFAEFAAPFIWILNANTMLAACHVAPLPTEARKMLITR